MVGVPDFKDITKSEHKKMLNYERHGKGKPLVLLHGYAGGMGYWRPMVTDLKKEFDVIALDLPGFAGSADEPAPDSIEGHASAVIELMDDLGVECFSLLGFSMGGMIAQQATLDYPTRIETLILYGSSAVGDLPHRFEPWEAAIEGVETEGVEAIADKTSVTWFVKGRDDPYYAECREACKGASPEACVKVMRAMQHWSSMDRLGELKLPTMVIVGDQDKSTKPSDSMVLWEGIEGSNLCVLPGCAHGAHMEKPSLFNQILADFLRESV